LQLNGSLYLDKHLRVDLAYKPEKNKESTVFLGNLPFNVTDEEIWEEFKEFGDIDYVRVIRDPHTFQGKGIGYVCFKEKNSSKRAISKNNSAFKGRYLRVSKVKDPNEDPKPIKYNPNKNNGFYNLKNLKNQADILDKSPIYAKTPPVPLKGIKKTVRKEQVKLQNKRKKRQESNTKTLKKHKKIIKD
jgi:nucleolar protein 12